MALGRPPVGQEHPQAADCPWSPSRPAHVPARRPSSLRRSPPPLFSVEVCFPQDLATDVVSVNSESSFQVPCFSPENVYIVLPFSMCGYMYTEVKHGSDVLQWRFWAKQGLKVAIGGTVYFQDSEELFTTCD